MLHFVNEQPKVHATCFDVFPEVTTCHVSAINKTLSNKFEFRLIYVVYMAQNMLHQSLLKVNH
jgi:hypothetical protein